MTVFGHELKQHTRLGAEGIPLLDVELWYDDGFGSRRYHRMSFDADRVAYVAITGTASSPIDVRKGHVIGVFDNRILVLSSANVVKCCYPIGETFEIYDVVFVVEHMNHNANTYGEFDLMATKREGAFNVHSVNIVCYDKEHSQVGIVHIDAFLGEVNTDELDTTRK